MEWPLSEQLIHCTCEATDTEDDSSQKFSGWECRPVTSSHASSPSTHHTIMIRQNSTSTFSAPSASTTSGISHTHHSSTHHGAGKSNSKHHMARILNVQEAPDIPFNVSEVYSNPQLRGLDDHSAHMEHYLSRYTYPHLEHMLVASLPAHTGLQCSHCSERSNNHLNGEREGLVRPSVVQVLLKDSARRLKSTRHLSVSQVQRSSYTLHGVHSSPLTGLHVGLSSSPNLTDTCSSTDTCTALVSLPGCRKHANAKFSSNPILSKAGTKWRRAGAYDTARHVYNMGVRWNPSSFPSFIVSSVNTASKTNPPHSTGRTANTKKRTSNNTSPGLKSEPKTVKNTAQMLHAPTHVVRGKKGRVRESTRQGTTDKPALTSTKTLSVTTPSHQFLTHTHLTSGKMPPIKPRNQGLLTSQRELSHLLRHRKSVSFRSGRASGFRYESLCLEGRSAATVSTGEVGEADDDDSVTVDLSSGSSRPPVKITGPWIN